MCGPVIIQRERNKPKDRKSHGHERHIPRPLAQDQRLARELASIFTWPRWARTRAREYSVAGFMVS